MQYFKSKQKFILLRLLNYFGQGLLYTAPIAITVYVLFLIFDFVDNLIPVKVPGLGILIVITLITTIGFLGSSLLGQPVMSLFQKLIERTPVIKDIYSTIKDVVGAFIGKKRKFTEPVLVKMGEGLEKMGFITQKDLSDFNIQNKIAVYLPYSYGIMGSLYIVEIKNITPLDASSTEVMKFIVSGGIIEPDADDEK